jgi:HD superfamily phosphohydrolase
MAVIKRKIINDPVYGFITINHPLIFSIIAHPWYQRLRRIQQMAMAQLVYPGRRAYKAASFTRRLSFDELCGN